MMGNRYQWWFDQFHDWHVREFDEATGRYGPTTIIQRTFDDCHVVWELGEHWFTMPLGNLFFNFCDWVPGVLEFAL